MVYGIQTVKQPFSQNIVKAYVRSHIFSTLKCLRQRDISAQVREHGTSGIEDRE